MQSVCNELSISQDLKSYIAFLKNNKLTEVVNDVIKLTNDFKLPFLKQIKGQPKEVVFQLFHLGINEFFEDILKENPVQGAVKLLLEWKQRRIAKEITSLTDDDIVSSYLIRKQVLISYIHEFSNDPLVYINLVQELNNIICLVEQAALSSLGAIK